MKRLWIAVIFVLAGLPAMAQTSMPPNTADTFRDTSMLKPPAGAKVAVWEFEDLECPACAYAYAFVHGDIEKYKVAFVRHDFPLQQHIWSFDAAVTARYLQDKVSAVTAGEFRRDVFAHQTAIASKDDLAAFTQAWFKSHALNVPAPLDPTGLFTLEVKSDRTLGERVGLMRTPSIFVVTDKGWVQVTDVALLARVIEQAMVETGMLPGGSSKAGSH